MTTSGDYFVACQECGFPVCRACYEYERKDGNKSCPQCKTRYKRHKGWSASHNMLRFFCYFLSFLHGRSLLFLHLLGSPRVEGDDDEDDIDDLEKEFSYSQGKSKAKYQWHGDDIELSESSRRESQQPIPHFIHAQLVSKQNLFSSLHYSQKIMSVIIMYMLHIFFVFC